MPRSSDSGPGCAPGNVDEGDDRQPEAFRQLHDPHRLAVALGVRHPEVAPDVLVGVVALLLADDRDPPAVDPGEPGDHRGVVAEEPVAVELDEAVGHRRRRTRGSAGGARFRASWTRAQTASRRVRGRDALSPSAWRRHAVVRSAFAATRSASELRKESGRNPDRLDIERPVAGAVVGEPTDGQEVEQVRQLVAQRRPGHDPVDEPVVEQELGALEAGRQLLGDRPGRDARAGEPDERIRLGDVDVTDRRERGEDAAGRRVGQDAENGTPAARRRSSAASVLASCISASVPSCIRAPPDARRR